MPCQTNVFNIEYGYSECYAGNERIVANEHIDLLSSMLK
jgi:hypothetical protein